MRTKNESVQGKGGMSATTIAIATVNTDSNSTYTSASESIEVLETTLGFSYKDMDVPFGSSIRQISYSGSSTHRLNLGLGPLRTILPLPSHTRTGSTANAVDGYGAGRRCVQFRIKRRKLLALDRHLAC